MSSILDTDWANTIAVLQEFGEKVRDQYRNNLEINRHIASGDLANNIKVIIVNQPDTLEVDLELEDYWYYVENGRGSGKMPPVQAIQDWITVKHIVPRMDEFGHTPTIPQLSWAIAKSIAKNGTPAVGHPFANAITSTGMDLETALGEAIMKDLDVPLESALSYVEI